MAHEKLNLVYTIYTYGKAQVKGHTCAGSPMSLVRWVLSTVPRYTDGATVLASKKVRKAREIPRDEKGEAAIIMMTKPARKLV